MKLRKVLLDVARVVAEEAERNPEFAAKLDAALYAANAPKATTRVRRSGSADGTGPGARRAKNRRPPAVLNPIELAKEGETTLRSKLSPLSLDQLRDIVADFGMDPGKLIVKWKDPQRVIDRIVELSVARSHKGDAFRE